MSPGGRRAGSGIRYEDRLALLILAGGLPAIVLALVLLWAGDYSNTVRWTLVPLLLGTWLGFFVAARARVVHPLRTLANMLAGLREGDYATRARSGREDDTLGELFAEANTLSRTLSEQRRTAIEAAALLRNVVAEIDVAVFTFDGDRRLSLANRAAETLMDQQSGEMLGKSADALGLADLLESTDPRIVDRSFARGGGRWGVRVSTFWVHGLPHRLLLVQDLTRALREEQVQAWKRLVRVIGHELNNSLTPIKSIAGSLRTLLSREPPASDWKDDALEGLSIIGGRAEALARFMDAYSRLAKLPPPRFETVRVRAWVARVAALETRQAVKVLGGPDLTVRGDPDQLDQLLINIVRNAVDAVGEAGGSADVEWRRDRDWFELRVRDEGHGLPATANLFVPFFTTKPGGSGIGLALSRQVAEAHGGELTLENRTDRSGCVALLRLPL